VLKSITGLHGYAYAPDNIVTPCAYPIPTGIEYETHGRGFDRHNLDVMVLSSTQNDAAGQASLDQFIGAGAASIRNAIWADKTLGGVVADCVVLRVRDYGYTMPDQNGARYYQAVLEIQVLAPGV
jgi:hypothetical protein